MKTLSTTRARWLKRLILGLAGGAALAMTLGGTGCRIEAGPVAPVGRSYVMHMHAHGPDCGHYRVWNDSMWVYYYDGHWEYNSPSSHRWVYYSAASVPAALHSHESSAKSHRLYAVPGYVRASGEPPRATKAEPSGDRTPGVTGAPGGVVRKTVPPAGSGGAPSTRGKPAKAPPPKSDHK